MQDDPHGAGRAMGQGGAQGPGRARGAGRGAARRLTLRAGRRVHPVLRLWDTGLALPAEAGADLRGRVDIYDGGEHLFHALIVASSETGPAGEVTCSFKRITAATATPPRDYSDADSTTDEAGAQG